MERSSGESGGLLIRKRTNLELHRLNVQLPVRKFPIRGQKKQQEGDNFVVLKPQTALVLVSCAKII